jgi:hypothetical protein
MNKISPIQTAELLSKDNNYIYFSSWVNTSRWLDKLDLEDKPKARTLLKKVDIILTPVSKEEAIRIYRTIFSAHAANYKAHKEEIARRVWITFLGKYPKWVHKAVFEKFMQDIDFPSMKEYKNLIRENTLYYQITKLLILKDKI